MSLDYEGLDSLFEAPLSPIQGCSSHPHEHIGKKLFENALAFYAWYLAWDTNPFSHAKAFKVLSQILHIAKVSLSGGHYLKEVEEQKAISLLSQMKEKLFNGSIRSEQILETLLRILHTLEEANPKARLVALTTEYEYRYCIDTIEKLSEDKKAACRKKLYELLDHITPELLDMNAHAIAQSIAQLIESPFQEKDPEAALDNAMKRWLPFEHT